MGVLPLTDEDLYLAMNTVVEAWLVDLPLVSEEESVINRIRDFAIRFQEPILNCQDVVTGVASPPSVTRRIFCQGLLLMPRASLVEACGDIPFRRALKALRAQRLLKTEAVDEMPHRFALPALGLNRGSDYAIEFDRLTAWGEASGRYQ